MPHPACHFSVTPMSRTDSRSAVAAAAYRAGGRYYDDRLGRFWNYTSKPDIAGVEVVGWNGDAASLWNSAETAEKRVNSRVAREITISLPCDLPLDRQRQLVRGFCLWLRDRYGAALMSAIHVPWLDGTPNQEEFAKSRRGNPNNHHVHIMMTTRTVDPMTGVFGAKLRVLDDRKTGPGEVKAWREEWQRRANREMERAGLATRVDLRSYADMAAAGDAPEGMIAQQHVGPKLTNLERKLRKTGEGPTNARRRRDAVRQTNEDMNSSWLTLRALEREKARAAESARRAAAAEERRKADAAAERARLATATTAAQRADALRDAAHLHAVDVRDPMAQAIAAAMADADFPARDPDPEFDQEIDPETYETPDTKEAPHNPIRVRRRGPRQRTRG